MARNTDGVIRWYKGALSAVRKTLSPGPMLAIVFSTAPAIGFELTGDRRFLNLMSLLLDIVYWNARGVNGDASAKWVAMFYRGFTRLLGHAWRHGLLDRYEYPSLRVASSEAEERQCLPAHPKP